MDGLKVYKISKNNYEARRSSKLFSFMWNPIKYKIYNFKKLGGVSDEYVQKGTLLKKPHIQMILQIQNYISERINENKMKHIKLFEEMDDSIVPEEIQSEYNILMLRLMDGSADPDIQEVENRIEELREEYPNIKVKY